MAHAERLTQQVKTLSARVKELERALAMTQTGSGTHPLLRDTDPRDGMDIVSELEGTLAAEMEEVSDAIGSLSIAVDGKTMYFGETASSEYLQNLIQESSDPAHMSNPKFLGLPSDIIELVNAYPFGVKDHPASTEAFKMFVPPRDRTETVAGMFYTNASWLYDPVPRRDFEVLFRDPIYQAVDGFLSFKSIPAHNFAVFFMVLATGLIFSPAQSAPILMEQYHALARAAFSLDSITRGASTASVQAMTMMIHYSYWTDRNGTEVRWLFNGLCARIAQMIGLQRDSAGWNLDKDEVQRRRMTFWEFYAWDAWSSVITGRPPVLNIAQSDCRFPEDRDTVVNSQGQLEPGWHKWKWMYNANCLTPSLQRTFSVRPLSYSSLLELDKRIRSFPLPEHLRPGSENGQGWSSDPFKAMCQHGTTLLRESNLLYIHRSYFAQAIRESNDPLQHKYGQSVLAAYQSTRALVSSLRGAYAVHPALVGKIWWFWSAIYSSCVILGAVVVEAPGCKLAESALNDLDTTISFFELGSASCRSPRLLPMLRTFHTRAHEAYTDYRRQIQAGNGPVTTPPKDRSNLDSPDELEVLGGRKTLV
ncbi:fungal-specific transcription factor domain-containing protein, partial [Vararia minispora EC-137]